MEERTAGKETSLVSACDGWQLTRKQRQWSTAAARLAALKPKCPDSPRDQDGSTLTGAGWPAL